MTQDLEQMRLMTESGCLGNVIGFESIISDTLEKMNKKGNMGVLLGFFIFVGILLGLGFLIGSVAGVGNMTFDEIVPEIQGIGMVGNINITEASDYSIVPLNSLIQQFTWLGVMVYMIALLGLFGLAISFRMSMNRWFIPIFFAFALMLIIGSMFMTNIYEDFYNDTDGIGAYLREQTLLSFLIRLLPSAVAARTAIFNASASNPAIASGA